MKYCGLIILLLICLCFAQSQRLQQIECPSCKRTIDIDSKLCPYCRAEIQWGDVHINATPSRNTKFRIQGFSGIRDVPFEGRMLVGNYRVIFIHDGKEYQRTLNVRANRTNSLFEDFSFTQQAEPQNFGYIEVKTAQRRTYIFLDGNEVSPNRQIKIQPAKTVRIQLASDGYASIDTMIEVREFQLATVTVDMLPLEYARDFNCQSPQLPKYQDTLRKNSSKFIGLALMGAGLVGITAPLVVNKGIEGETEGMKKEIPQWHKITIGISSVMFLGGAIYMGTAGRATDPETVEANRKLREDYEARLEAYRICRQEESVRQRIIVKNPIRVEYRSLR